MTRGRALLRNYVATPEPAEARPAKLPAMRGNQTMSAPARPDLWLVEEDCPPVVSQNDPAVVQPKPHALSTALMGATPVPQPLERRRAHTLVPSALDAHSFTTLSEDDAWFGDNEPVAHETWDGDWTVDDDTLEVEVVAELPRVLGAVVELGVFFAGLTIGLAVQGAFAWALWMTLI